MKKTFLLATILFISVISTACINNFAVQELNSKAKAYMEKGDYTSAIERLKSGVDLDASVFETRYNLAVAYTMAEDYLNAIDSYNEAIKLNPDFADSYYSLAVCEENLAKDIESKEVIVNEDNTIEKYEPKDDDDIAGEDKELPDVAKDKILTLLDSSISDYQIYLDKSAGADKGDIEKKIEELKAMSEKYAK